MPNHHEDITIDTPDIVRFSRAGNSWWAEQGTAILRVESKADEMGFRSSCTIELHSEEAIDSLIRVAERCRENLRRGGVN